MPVSSCTNLSVSEQAVLKKFVRQVLNNAVIDKSLILPSEPQSLSLLAPGACFVTLYTDQQLRGCIGTYVADQPLWLNVCRYSYYSACEDRRFTPIAKNELANIRFEISVLSELAPIANAGEQALLTQLKAGIDGLLLKEGYRSAIFLPSVWQALTTPSEFLQALKLKGGWPANYWSQDIELFRFTTFVIEGENKNS
ncbi:MAG: AmmeMemoRadiSam system protein A [Psychromonas sp.]|jgi:AmmeMemoRadiSam system protein A|uniref:AmmeMemoRadiSam system protein A n=1 Tax=Psychromonas sp. TaxID=1884585 RepID=UPI0039E3D676